MKDEPYALEVRRNLLKQGEPLAGYGGLIGGQSVTLPPGLAKFTTTPLPTGSAIPTNTLGIERDDRRNSGQQLYWT